MKYEESWQVKCMTQKTLGHFSFVAGNMSNSIWTGTHTHRHAHTVSDAAVLKQSYATVSYCKCYLLSTCALSNYFQWKSFVLLLRDYGYWLLVTL